MEKKREFHKLGYNYFFSQDVSVDFGKEATAPTFQTCISGTFLLTVNLLKSHVKSLGSKSLGGFRLVLRLLESQFPP